ncbi:MAG: SDR family NAD(P)-dependent oxidoreductase [Candidatus Micrarchaeota archaeon]
MNSILEGKTVLVTGGVGSVGSALVERLLDENVRTVRVLDLDETKEFEMRHRLKNHPKLRLLVGDVRDKGRMVHAMEGVDIVFHCAALKHVLSCEYNPFEAVKTNVLGTQNVVEAALENNVERVIFTSSDKAVNPTNVMGTSKLLAERLVTAGNYYKGGRKTVLASVRFGNVVGSRGSVVPLFKKQIAKGGPVTITNPDMTRFVMTNGQTIDLLFKALELSQGGEVFILKMPVVKVDDLADTMIETYGAGNPKRVEKVKKGTLPGEKMHEELMTEDEGLRALEREDMFVLPPQDSGGFDEVTIGVSMDKYNAKKATIDRYSSGQVKPMGKEEIVAMLKMNDDEEKEE